MSAATANPITVRVHLDDSEDPPHLERILQASVTELVRHVMGEEGIDEAEVDLVFCGDGRIADLNEEWLDHAGPTDVLTFDLSERTGDGSGPLEGEIYIDLAQAARQAPEFQATLDEEIRRLVIHGVLHLIGFDDTGDTVETERMRTHQEALVEAWSEPVLEVKT